MCPQWFADRGVQNETHDISAGLRENYRKRWKSAIAAVRASNKLRGIAASASQSSIDSSSIASGGIVGGTGTITPPTKKELYSDEDEEEDSWHETTEDHDGVADRVAALKV